MRDEHASTVVTQITQVGAEAGEVEPAAGQLQLVVIGRGTLATYPVPEGLVTIGRSTSCDVTIEDESISRRHAILAVGKRLTIEDLGSANGTHVRGNKLETGYPVAISVGELIGLGRAHVLLQRRSRTVRPRRLWSHDDFEARLEEECARAQRSGAAFALLHIQPEARVPESFVEETLGELVRESDILGKHATQHYEVLLPDTPPAKADEAATRLERKLRERGLTCRIAVACCPRDGKSPYQLAARVRGEAITGDRASGARGDIVVADPQMQSLHELVQQIADSQLGVLLLGETGVGKEVFARAVHRASPRAQGPFVEINCAAVTDTLLESELFGHEKGAFTNATSAKPGLVELADGGTLLLDEIGDMPLATQAKLLRVIEDAQLRRVGATKPRAIDVRFVAATNQDLERRIEAGAFRRDLYFRLNGITIVIPPLRERLAELETLARAFIAQAAKRSAGPAPALSPEALELMMRYAWPGNVRELKHVMERAVLLCGDGPIRPTHLPADRMRAPAPAASAPAPPEAPVTAPPGFAPRPRKGSPEELQAIMAALEQVGGNQTAAARLLGISRRTLVNRLNDNEQLDRPRKGKGDKA